MNPLELLRSAPLFQQAPLAIAINVVVYVCFLLIAFSVVADFAAYHRRSDIVVQRRSWVETGSMAAFAVAYYLAVRFRLLEVLVPKPWRGVVLVVGIALMLAGSVVNVTGRLYLKSNWANQIRIYEGHWLVTGGPFGFVRHPLYASLIWMFVGGSLVYGSVAGLLLTFGVFVPMMYVRAKKEDALLAEAFGEAHEAYRRRTGMLFPRLPR
ncbi:MAG TPA: isoprenylcysteine carboxylmethyltransferase family protein [Coriobacteriia bacterium]|nr:isoprenylcysteine carboxylmethyltransferase family protein [Coriobacteriia bacterium]